jgi:hypothetical protein
MENVECLIRWPKGSQGWYAEYSILKTLLAMCESQGYGRIPQLAKQIEEIWRDPKKVEYFQGEQARFLAEMESHGNQ